MKLNSLKTRLNRIFKEQNYVKLDQSEVDALADLVA